MTIIVLSWTILKIKPGYFLYITCCWIKVITTHTTVEFNFFITMWLNNKDPKRCVELLYSMSVSLFLSPKLCQNVDHLFKYRWYNLDKMHLHVKYHKKLQNYSCLSIKKYVGKYCILNHYFWYKICLWGFGIVNTAYICSFLEP